MANEPSQSPKTETRRRLIGAGLLLFGLHGLDATSTRALAKEAGVNLAAIPYHFGGKEGLYRAVLEHIVAVKLAEIGPCLAHVRDVCADPATDRAGLLDALRELIRTLVPAMLDDPKSHAATQIVLQEQIAPTEAFTFVHEQFLRRIHAALAAVLSRLVGLPQDSPEMHLRAMSVMGQIFIFQVGLHSLLTLVGGEELTEAQVAAITAVCVQQAQAQVAGFAPALPGGDL